MTRLVIIAGLAVALSASACGAARSVPNPVQPKPAGTTPQSQLLNQIVASVAPSGISAASTADPPSGFQGGQSSWVNLTIPPGDSEADIADEWKAALVAGTFRDLSPSHGLPVVFGYTTPQGARLIGNQDHASPTVTPTSQSVQAALKRVGLAPKSISILAPGEGRAVEVIATTGTSATDFLDATPNPATAVFGDLAGYAGTYLEIDDPQGVAYVTAYANIDGEGVQWVRPGLPTSSLKAVLGN